MSCWTQLATGRHRGRHFAQPTVLSHAWFCGKTAVGTRYGAPKLGGCAPKTRFVARRCAREYYSVEEGAQNVPERGHPWEKTRSTRVLQGCSRASLIDHCHRHRHGLGRLRRLLLHWRRCDLIRYDLRCWVDSDRLRRLLNGNRRRGNLRLLDCLRRGLRCVRRNNGGLDFIGRHCAWREDARHLDRMLLNRRRIN